MTPQEQAIRDAIDTEVAFGPDASRWATRCGYLLSLLDAAREPSSEQASDEALAALHARASLPASPPLAPVESGKMGEYVPMRGATTGHEYALNTRIGWICRRHPDGQWVTWRQATDDERAQGAALASARSCPPPSPAVPDRNYLASVVTLARAEPSLPTESVIFQAGVPGRVGDVEHEAAYALGHDEHCDTRQPGPQAGPSTKPCNCPAPSPAEGSERARKVEAMLREVVALNPSPLPGDMWERSIACLALPAGPPESDAVYREVYGNALLACVRGMAQWGGDEDGVRHAQVMPLPLACSRGADDEREARRAVSHVQVADG